MKMLQVLALIVIFSQPSYSQSSGNKKATTDVTRAFTWDIQKEARGALMFLDVAYQRDNSDTTEYLTLTVAKDKTKPRPDFISIILPANITQSNGIFITFAKTTTRNGEQTMELQKAKPVRIHFENCNQETCTARMVNGYATHDNGTREDVFQKFLTYDHVLFLFVYPDGSHKSVAVPLFSFRQQYKKL